MQTKRINYFDLKAAETSNFSLNAPCMNFLPETDLFSFNQFANDVDEQGFTALHLVAGHNCTAMALRLLNSNIPVNIKSKAGYTPLHLAVYYGHFAMVKLLMSYSADHCAKNICGLTPLHMATKSDSLELVEYLIALSGDINAMDLFGNTPLHLSAFYGSRKIIELLIKSGADCTARNIRGETPAKMAINNDKHSVAGLFMRMQIEKISSHEIKFSRKNGRPRIITDKLLTEALAI